MTCNTIDWSKKHNFQRQHFFEFSFTAHFSSSIIVDLNVNLFNKTKYTIRCSVKSSTIYKLKFILIVHFLFSKKVKLCATNFCYCEKIIFLRKREFLFFYFIFVSPNMFSLKKNKIYHKMQREKFYSLQRTVYFISVLFMFKKTPTSVRSVFVMARIGRTAFCFCFENKKCTIKINFSL